MLSVKRIIAIALTALLGTSALAAVKNHKLTSPDGRISVVVTSGNGLSWSVSMDGKQLLAPSAVSVTIDDGSVYGEGKLKRAETRSVSREISTALYKKSLVEDKYNELTFTFSDCRVVFRAYDSGVAYRFISRSRHDFKVLSEKAEFRFAQDWPAYVPYTSVFNSSFEKQYTLTELSEFDSRSMSILPMMVKASDGIRMNIMESSLYDYPGMYLRRGDDLLELRGTFAAYPEKVAQGGHNSLQGIVGSRRDYIAYCSAEEKFPWRIIAIGDDRAMADCDLVWLLGEDPAEGSDWDWVKPGKVAWEWWNGWNVKGVDFKAGINNDTYKFYIDFAAEYGIEYVILDEGWSVKGAADLMKVVPEIDIKELVDYAAARNVGIILWAGYWAFDRDMENICRHYSSLGVKGFKIDFMDRDDQMMVAFHSRAAATAAKYRLLVDFHGTYKPSGLSRTWPNVLNYEGVFGCEQMKWCKSDVNQPLYDVLMPFIRQCAGPVDYTQGAMNNAARGHFRANYSEPMSMGTRCHQLAEYMVFDSPLCMLCDTPINYRREPECTRFIASVPTVWDETRVLDGRVGECIVTARRKGDEWYVGGICSWKAINLKIDLGFLGDGLWTAEIFRDGVNASRNGTDYIREIRTVEAGSSFGVEMAPGGGVAMRLKRK